MKSLIRYRHRQNGSIAYRLQAARPALTGQGLRLTAMSCTGLPFYGRYARAPCNYMDHYSLLIYQPHADGRLSWLDMVKDKLLRTQYVTWW